MIANLDFDIPQMVQTWSIVREIRDEVAGMLAAQPRAIREGAAMVASELAENALKYGQSVPELPQARLMVELEPEEICIEVHSGVGDSARVQVLLDTIAELSTGSPEKLYTQRLFELAQGAALAPARMGLLRIVHEGAFQLQGRRDGSRLIIRARRALGGVPHKAKALGTGAHHALIDEHE